MEFESASINCTVDLNGYDPAKSDSAGVVGIGAGFLLGLSLSFMPQIVNIIRRRSGRGISIIFCLCSASMGTSNFTAAALLQRSKFDCCAEWGFAQCNEQMLPVYALMMQAVMTTAIFILVAGFSFRDQISAQARAAGKLASDHYPAAGDAEPPEHPMRVLRTVGALFVGFAVLQVVLPLVFVHQFRAADDASKIDDLGRAMGTTSVIFTFIQYIPQLLTTYRLKGLGSFSKATLCIQAFGGLGFGSYLAFAGEQKPTTWMPPMVTGAFQIALLCMAVYYRKSSSEGESDPLLAKSINRP